QAGSAPANAHEWNCAGAGPRRARHGDHRQQEPVLQFKQRDARPARIEDQHDPEQHIVPGRTGPGQRQSRPADLSGDAPRAGAGHDQPDFGVKDQLPVHGKSELNNQSSPGTPELRVNSSAVYDNLWQWEHSLGAQYSFSPEQFKHGDQWNFYDEPLVANYSGFYRMPIGSPEAIEDLITARPGTFGYDEATRKFRLPPPSGLPELNVYASRSTIDTGLEMPSPEVLLQTPDRTVTKGTSQEDITINEDLGFRFTQPLPEFDGIRSTVSAGLDYKTYRINSDKTYIYTFIEILHHTPGDVGTPVVGTL